MPGFPEDCVVEDRCVAWLLAARMYPQLRTQETSVHILPSEILRMVHRRLVGSDHDVEAITAIMRQGFPSEVGRARRVTIDALNFCDGSVLMTIKFLLRGARVTRPSRVRWVAPAEGVEEEPSPHVNCTWDYPCEGCSGRTTLL